LGTLINNDSFADVVFTVENKKIYGHKAILASQSTYLRDIFLSSGINILKTQIEQGQMEASEE
jgi:hypothetical protein